MSWVLGSLDGRLEHGLPWTSYDNMAIHAQMPCHAMPRHDEIISPATRPESVREATLCLQATRLSARPPPPIFSDTIQGLSRPTSQRGARLLSGKDGTDRH